MITYIKGNLFESPAQTLVNTVNTEGVMGKGIAKEFKRLFPDMFNSYQKYCESGELTIGKLWVYETDHKWVLNFPTKTTWRKPSRFEYIELGLKNFVSTYIDRGIISISFPPLGCGNGELDWEKQVRSLMEKYLNKLPIDIFIHLYDPKDMSIPEHRNIKEIEKWLKSEPQHLGFEEVYRDLTGILSDWVSLDKDSTAKIKNSKGIEIKYAGKKSLVAKDDLMEFWRLFRNYGYILKNIAPPNLEKHFKALVRIFERLPYCNELKISQKYNDLNSPDTEGLQFQQITARESQGDLFQVG